MSEEKKQPVAEPMQLAEPAKREAKAEGAGGDIEKLISALDRIGVKSPEDLEGMRIASQQAGRYANLLGDQKREIEELRRQISTRNQPQETYSQESPAIDLKREIRNVLREFYQEDIIRPQQEAANKYWADMEYIKQSEHYPLVEDTWQQHFNSPATQRRLQRGESDVAKEFQKVVMDTYRDLALQARDALRTVRGVGSPASKPPHVEGGPSPAPARTTTEGEKAERVDKIKKDWRGTDTDVDKMLEVLLPKNDPIMRVPR